MLLISRNRPVSVDALIDAVWDEDPVPAARTSIQSYVSNLRRLLRNAGVDPYHGAGERTAGISTQRRRRRLRYRAFHQPKRPRAFRPPPRGSSRTPAATCRPRWVNGAGRSLDDLRDFAFVDAYATALMEEKVAAHTARAEAEIACGRPGAVIGELEVLAAEHPYHEPCGRS